VVGADFLIDGGVTAISGVGAWASLQSSARPLWLGPTTAPSERRRPTGCRARIGHAAWKPSPPRCVRRN